MLAIAFLLFVLIIVCVIKRNRGGKYAVHERELAAGRGDYPDEGGFHEYSQPLDSKSAGGRASLASSSHHDGKHAESDTDSMAEYGEGDTGTSSFFLYYYHCENVATLNLEACSRNFFRMFAKVETFFYHLYI